MRSKTSIIIFITFILFTTPGKGQLLPDAGLLTKKELNKTKVYTSLNEALTEPEDVVILDLTGQNLDSLPSSIGQFRNLQVLRLGWKIKDSTPKRIIRKSKKVGGGMMHLDRLQGVYIDYNNLTSLPKTIVNLKKLQEIDLGYNALTEVPVELVQLNNLKFINLIGCYGLLNEEIEMKEFKRGLSVHCVLWSDIGFE